MSGWRDADPRDLLSWAGWELSDAPFIAGVVDGWPGADGAFRDSLVASCRDGLREEVAALRGTVCPNDGGTGALVDEMRSLSRGVAPVLTSLGGVSRVGTAGWDGLLAQTRAVDAMVSGYVDAPRPVRTGVGGLDAVIGGGVYPGLNVLMAEPGAGKTALAVQMLAANAVHGGHSLMFSIEMPVWQVKMRVAAWLSEQRAMSAESRGGTRPYGLVRWSGASADGAWSSLDWGAASEACPVDADRVAGVLGPRPTSVPLAEAADRLRPLGLVGSLAALVATSPSDDTGRALADAEATVFPRMAVTHDERDVATIAAEIRRVAGDLGRAPLVCVDYLQLVRGSADAESMGETEVTKQVSGELARAAADTGAAIVCVTAKRKGGDGGMGDARGSGSIAYDAQSVMHLSPDRGEGSPADPWRRVTLSVSKNRSGPVVPSATLWFDGARNFFYAGDRPPGVGDPGF